MAQCAQSPVGRRPVSGLARNKLKHGSVERRGQERRAQAASTDTDRDRHRLRATDALWQIERTAHQGV